MKLSSTRQVQIGKCGQTLQYKPAHKNVELRSTVEA